MQIRGPGLLVSHPHGSASWLHAHERVTLPNTSSLLFLFSLPSPSDLTSTVSLPEEKNKRKHYGPILGLRPVNQQSFCRVTGIWITWDLLCLVDKWKTTTKESITVRISDHFSAHLAMTKIRFLETRDELYVVTTSKLELGWQPSTYLPAVQLFTCHSGSLASSSSSGTQHFTVTGSKKVEHSKKLGCLHSGSESNSSTESR